MGGWSLVLPKGGRNPDAAFGYLEFKLGDEQQLRWADQFESIPSVKSAATSERYYAGRPERRLAVADAPVARFVIGAPGGDTALAHQSGVATTILQRRMTVQDALNDAVQKVQQELDDAYRSCSV
jgi:ABC-type glycerol-3-phosphate transport system substrate-binding protein